MIDFIFNPKENTIQLYFLIETEKDRQAVSTYAKVIGEKFNADEVAKNIVEAVHKDPNHFFENRQCKKVTCITKKEYDEIVEKYPDGILPLEEEKPKEYDFYSPIFWNQTLKNYIILYRWVVKRPDHTPTIAFKIPRGEDIYDYFPIEKNYAFAKIDERDISLFTIYERQTD